METTDINDGAVLTADQNPSNGLDYNQLLNNLIGTAGTAYQANQYSEAQQAYARAGYSPYGGYNIAALFSGPNSKAWLLLGAGLIMFALVLRR